MVKILGLLVLCAALFGGGLAGSLYLRSLQEDAPGAEGETAAADPQGAGIGAEQPAVELPVAMHSGPVSADEVFRFAASIRGRERQLQARQEAIEQQESRLKMMQEDLRGQRRELEGLLADLQDTLQRSTSALQKVQDERRQLQQDQQQATRNLDEAKKLQTADQLNQHDNIKRLAEWIQGTTPEFAGKYVHDEIKAGKLKTTVQMLAEMEPRTTAKILENVGDSQLVSELSDEVLKLRPPPNRKQQ